MGRKGTKPDQIERARRRKAVRDALMLGATVAEASAQTGVPVPTIYMWRRLPKFSEAIDRQAKAIKLTNHDFMVSVSRQMIEVLRDIAFGAESDAARVAAARDLLDRCGLAAPPVVKIMATDRAASDPSGAVESLSADELEALALVIHARLATLARKPKGDA